MKTLFAFIAFALVLVGCASPQRHTRTWEYKTVCGHVLDNENTLGDAINKEIAQGWEFVSADRGMDFWGFAVLRREKK